MRWLLIVLQWLFPLLLLLAAAARASLPSLLYLFAFFICVTWPPLRELAAPITFNSTAQGADGSSVPGTPASRHRKTKSSAFTLSASASFTAPAPAASAPFESTATWQSHRAFFFSLSMISGGMVIAQLIVHALYWSSAWHPAGQSDGDTSSNTNPSLIRGLQALSLAPWGSVSDGFQSLTPDVGVLIASVATFVVTGLSANGRIRWVRRAYCFGGDERDENGAWNRERIGRGPAAAATLPSAILLLHFFIGVCLFFSAILQPSLLSLPYYVVLCVLLLAQIFAPAADARASDGDFVQPAMFQQGSRSLSTLLSLASLYLMAHQTLLHVFQFSIVLGHIDRSSPWLGRLGLFVADISSADGVALVQWGSMLAIICCFIAISLKRLSIEPQSQLGGGSNTMKRQTVAEMRSPASPDPQEERKTGAPLQLHPSAVSADMSPQSDAGWNIRRSLFSQSSFELKSFIVRSFRNHGLLLVFALVLVQVMMVHDLFNVVNVGVLLICMSLANVPHWRRLLIGLLYFQVVWMLTSTLVKYLCYIPFLISTPANADADPFTSQEFVMTTFGLLKHQDGFTDPSKRQGAYTFLYLLDGVLPAMLISVFLIVHRVDPSSLNVLNLFNAASTGDTTLLQRFLKFSPELLNVRDRAHKTVLHVAAANGHVATVRLIMDHVDINAQDKLGNTALHYCYKYGYDSIIHLLLSSASKGSTQGRGRQSLNLINTELGNKKGLKPAEMKQTLWTRIRRQARSAFLVVEGFFFSHASKLTLLLLFFVASQSVNILHLIYFLFFLLFFSVESVAQRLWNLLVAYCALVFFALYTFSVVEPLYALDTARVNQGTDWIRYLGFFSVRDASSDGLDHLDLWWSRLLIYYGIYVLAVVQKMVYKRGEELGMIRAQRKASPNPTSPFVEDEDGLDSQLRRRARSQGPSKAARVAISLLTYLTLLIVAMLNVSLFHLGYLFILVCSLLVHQFATSASKLFSGFWALSIVYTAGVLLAQYAFLLPEFRRWLERTFNWHRFSLYDIGFRAQGEAQTNNAALDELTSDSVLLILLPPTACFVMTAYYLKTLIQSLRARNAPAEQPPTLDQSLSQTSRPLPPPTTTTLAAGPASRRAHFGTLGAPIRSPPAAAAPGHRRVGSSPSAVEKREFEEAPSTAIDIEDSPPAPAHLRDFSILSPPQRLFIDTKLYAVYLFCLNVLAHQSAQLLTLYILLYVLLFDTLSLLSLFYVLLLIVWLPLDGRSLGNSLWCPLTLYAAPLILAKYLFQFPSLVENETDLVRWIGFRHFNGQLIRNLIGDLGIVAIATLQRVATKTMRKLLEEKKLVEQEQAEMALETQKQRTTDGRGPSPEAQLQSREQIALAIEAERVRQQHALLDTLAEEEDEAAPESSPAARKSRLSSAGAKFEQFEERKTNPSKLDTTLAKPQVRNVMPSPTPLPSSSAAATAAEEAPKPSRSEYFVAVVRELWIHLLDVVSAFYRHYGLEISLLFLLLMSFARSNALSLVYVLFYCGIWISCGGRLVIVRSQFLYISLLSLLAVSIVFQYLLLLGMPPGWLSAHSYPWASYDPVVLQWLLLGNYTSADLMWDCWCYVFMAWFIPYWRLEREELDKQGRLAGSTDSDSPAGQQSSGGSGVPSGTATPKLGRDLLSKEHRQQMESEGLTSNPAASAGLGSEMYLPPALEQQQDIAEQADTPTKGDSHALNLLKGDATAASLDPSVATLWSNCLFYSGLVIDKLLFLFIFLIGTSHNNLFSCIYLIFSCWYLLQNYLFDAEPRAFRSMWKTLRSWNFAILVAYVLYQIPWVPYLFLSDANLRWEMIIGLHKFVRPTPNSRFNTAAYLRVFTDPLGDRGALPQILIFLLIEMQLLILDSPVFQRAVLGWYSDVRRMSQVRRESSSHLYREWLISRIKTILLFREKLEASFTYIFLEASKLNTDFFQDEMVWPQPKPQGWDARVQNLLLEDSIKAFEREKQMALQQEGTPAAAAAAPSAQGEVKTEQNQGSKTSQEAAAVFSGGVAPPTLTSPAGSKVMPPTHARTPTDSELGDADVANAATTLRSAFKGSAQGPMQSVSVTGTQPEEAVPPPKKRRASVGSLLEPTEEAPAEDEAEKTPEVGKWESFLNWLKKPLLPHIDPVFWTRYAEDSKGDLVVVSVPDANTLRFGQAVWRFWLSNTQWICFLLYFLNLMLNGNLMSMVVPVVILCYAMFERPRAPRGFWLFALLWSSIVISAKFVFQLYMFCTAIDTSAGTAGAIQLDRKYIFAPSPYCVSASNSDGYSVDGIFGLRKLNTHTYFTIILIDLVCMLSIVMHRTVMMARGLWYINEEEVMAQQEAKRRFENEQAEREAQEQAEEDGTAPKIIRKRSIVLDGVESQVAQRAGIPVGDSGPSAQDLATASDMQVTLHLLQREEEQREEEQRKQNMQTPIEKAGGGMFAKLRHRATRLWFKYAPLELQYYYADLMPRERFHMVNVHKPGYDFYLGIFLVELIAAVWILACYDFMASTSVNSVSSSISTNLFSGNMVLTLFIQILIIILDRVCYLYRSILSKLVLQYSLIAYWFSKIFFDWPASSQTAFVANSYLQFFFFLKLVYFIISGLQLYTGFPPLETAGFQFLTRFPGMWNVYAYKIYKAVPFVFELRTMLDWMCSVSSLDVWDTLKLEEIYGTLYTVQCDIIYRRWHERGTSRPLIEKLCSGVLLFILLLVIIFGPLLLFSTANPVSQTNPVVSAEVSLSLTSQEGEYPLVDITSYVLQQPSFDYYIQLQNEDLIQSSDRYDSLQSVQMAPYSDKVWSISPPSLTQLMNSLNDHTQLMSIKFEYTFTRAAGPTTDKEVSNIVQVQIDQPTQSALARLINSTLVHDTALASVSAMAIPPTHDEHAIIGPAPYTPVAAMSRKDSVPASPFTGATRRAADNATSVTIPYVVPVFLRLPATSDPIELTGSSNRSAVEMTLDVSRGADGDAIVRWWFVNETDGVTESNIHFITVSNRIFSGFLSNLSINIVSVYIIILFTIGQFVRLLFGGQVVRIPVEDLPNANKLVMIVEGIYIARQKKQLAKEEILYRRLLKIYRTPALLLLLTTREDTPEEIAAAAAAPSPPPENGPDGKPTVADNPAKSASSEEEDKDAAAAAAPSSLRSRRAQMTKKNAPAS